MRVYSFSIEEREREKEREREREHLLQSPSIEYHRCGTYVIVVTLRACSRIITIFSSFTMTVSGASISWGSTYTWNDNETRNEYPSKPDIRHFFSYFVTRVTSSRCIESSKKKRLVFKKAKWQKRFDSLYFQKEKTKYEGKLAKIFSTLNTQH